jgi:hypothetical protein
MIEQWKDIPGFEGRYQVSDLGRVKALSFMQRWRHGLRRVRERILAQQAINSGYQIVHLHLDNVRSARTVHRLVAQVFHPGADPALDVNHMDGDKKNNAATNLEWLERGANHDHAVRLGLNTTAMRVRGYPINGGPPVEFDSQSQAALQLEGVRNGTKVSACIRGTRKTAMGYRWEQI